MFRICSEFSVMFRICSEFSEFSEFSAMFRIFSNVQNLFRIFSNVQNLFRIFRNFQNFQTLFRISSTKTGLFRISWLSSDSYCVPPYETFSLIKKNILSQSKIYKNHFEYSNFLGWSCDIQFHKYAVHINGDFLW
jgi:hypothetical protein